MSQNDPSPNNEVVPGVPIDPMQGDPKQGASSVQDQSASYVQESAPPQNQFSRPRANVDSNEFARMSPQIMILLVISGVKRSWKWALPIGLVLSAVMFVLLYICFPVRYEAVAYIQILSHKPYFIFDEQQRQQYKQYVQTQFALMRSPLIIEKALESSDIARLPCVLRQKDKVIWLAQKLKLQTQGDSEMVTVSIREEVPEDCEKLVNAVVGTYFDYYTTQSMAFNQKLLSQLQLELGRQRSVARMLQSDIRQNLEKAAQQGGAAGRDGLSGGMSQGESIERDLYLNESKLDALISEEKMLKELMTNGVTQIPQSFINNAIANDPGLRILQQRRADLQERLSSVKKTLARPDDPQILTIQTQINEIEKKLEEEFSNMGTNKIRDIQGGYLAQVEQWHWEKSMAIRSQEILVTSLNEKWNKQKIDVGSRTVQIADVSFQQDHLKRVNSILDQLETRVASLDAEKYAPEQIELKKKATVPTHTDKSKQITFAAIGAFGCLCFPLFLGIAIERMKPRLYHVSQIRRAIPQVIIGEIMEPPVAWIHGATFRKRLARYRESVHNWCTHLLLSDPFRNCKTLSVASVSGDDGKTFLAVQVAVAMAQMKSGPVLLIDADMRVGRLHLLFGNEETGIGLADVLSFRSGLGEAVVMNEREPNLYLLSAGQLDVSPYELLGDGRFRELLDVLQNRYSLVLVVLPPVANAAESLIMAASTDSVLLCVRQGETILAAMEDVFRKLVCTGSFVDGIVVKDIPYYQMAGKDGGFVDKLEQIRLAHLLQYAD